VTRWSAHWIAGAIALALAGCGGPSMNESDPPRQPILHWTMDDLNGTNTGTAAGYQLEFSGVVSTVPGEVGEAAWFGTGAFGIVSGDDRAALGVSPQYTISLWIDWAPPITTGIAVVDFLNRTAAPYGGVQLGFKAPGTFNLCVATATNPSLTGGCAAVAAPASGGWHNVILRYAGTGTGAGQGAGVDLYEDGVLAATVPNDADNNPVFNQSLGGMYLGTGGVALDDVRIYDQVFSAADQCALLIGGTWSGAACTLP
jgi:hypothetical protein